MRTSPALHNALSAVSINSGDLVYLTGAVYGVTGNDPAGTVISTVLDLLGPQGTLVIPTFAFAFCDHGVFDRERTPSFCGSLAERFRQWDGAIRTFCPPVHTVAACGARADEIAAIKAVTSFGASSVFQWLVDQHAKICLLACTASDGVAHVHWLEEKYNSPYRMWRIFDGQIIVDGVARPYKYRRYVRRGQVSLDAGPLLDDFMGSPCVRRSQFDFTVVELFRLSDFTREVEPLFKLNTSILLNSGLRGRRAEH